MAAAALAAGSLAASRTSNQLHAPLRPCRAGRRERPATSILMTASTGFPLARRKNLLFHCCLTSSAVVYVVDPWVGGQKWVPRPAEPALGAIRDHDDCGKEVKCRASLLHLHQSIGAQEKKKKKKKATKQTKNLASIFGQCIYRRATFGQPQSCGDTHPPCWASKPSPSRGDPPAEQSAAKGAKPHDCDELGLQLARRRYCRDSDPQGLDRQWRL